MNDENALSSGLAELMETLANAGALPWDNPDAAVAAIPDASLRLLNEGWLAYLRGDFEQTKQSLRAISSEPVRLYASALAVAAAACTGDYPLFQKTEAYCKNLMNAGLGANVTAVAEWALSVAYASAYVPAMIPDWMKAGDYSVLPPPLRQEAIHLRARWLLFEKKYASALDVAQTGLAFYERGQGVSPLGISARILRVAACSMLGRWEDAKSYLLEVMRDCLPLGFTVPFADIAPLFGNLLETCFTGEFAGLYDTVMKQSKYTVTNWLDIHNRLTKDSITLVLPPRYYQIALFVAQGDSRKDIAARFNISVGRLGNIIDAIYSSLHINNRKDLANFIL